MNQAVNEIELETLEGERGLPSVNARNTSDSAKKGLGILFLLIVLLLGGGFVYFYVVRQKQAADAAPPPKSEQLENRMPAKLFADAPPPPPEAPQEALAAGPTVPAVFVPEPLPGQPSAQVVPAGPSRPALQLDKSAASLMVGETQGGAGGTGEDAAGEASAAAHPGMVGVEGAGTGGGSSGGGLGSLLNGTSTPMAAANRLTDRNFTLAKGAFIDCVLQTRLDTTVPGMSACVVTRNIYSDNGKVLLIERGSTVIGEYSSGVQEGMNRIFVLWTRIKTPNGITMNLDSPGTDPLGASGLGGRVNNHFFKRFGAAMLLSLVDDAAAYAATRHADNGGGPVYYGNTSDAAQDMASKTLDKTLSIPPTLYKNQGERINIFVARDLYFGNVYALRSY